MIDTRQEISSSTECESLRVKKKDQCEFFKGQEAKYRSNTRHRPHNHIN